MEDDEWALLVNQAIYLARFQARCTAIELQKMMLDVGILSKKQ